MRTGSLPTLDVARAHVRQLLASMSLYQSAHPDHQLSLQPDAKWYSTLQQEEFNAQQLLSVEEDEKEWQHVLDLGPESPSAIPVQVRCITSRKMVNVVRGQKVHIGPSGDFTFWGTPTMRFSVLKKVVQHHTGIPREQQRFVLPRKPKILDSQTLASRGVDASSSSARIYLVLRLRGGFSVCSGRDGVNRLIVTSEEAFRCVSRVMALDPVVPLVTGFDEAAIQRHFQEVLRWVGRFVVFVSRKRIRLRGKAKNSYAWEAATYRALLNNIKHNKSLSCSPKPR